MFYHFPQGEARGKAVSKEAVVQARYSNTSYASVYQYTGPNVNTGLMLTAIVVLWVELSTLHKPMYATHNLVLGTKLWQMNNSVQLIEYITVMAAAVKSEYSQLENDEHVRMRIKCFLNTN